jgi:hypothetical protein
MCNITRCNPYKKLLFNGLCSKKVSYKDKYKYPKK